jgi:hypothetical protein
MRPAIIIWKRDPYSIFGRMCSEPWACFNYLKRQGARIEFSGLLTWVIHWPNGTDTPKRMEAE